MYTKTNLMEVARRNSFGDWEKIKEEANAEAGFIIPPTSELEVLQKNFSTPIKMSIENVRKHAQLIYFGSQISGNLELDPKTKRKITILSEENKILANENVFARFICPDCENHYEFKILVKSFAKDSPFCKKCQKKVLHKCDSYRKNYTRSMRETYGVDFPIQLDVFREKMAETMVTRYGAAFSPLCPLIESKRKKTMVEKYGRENFFSGINPVKLFNLPFTSVSKVEKEFVDEVDKLLPGIETNSYKTKQKKFNLNNSFGYIDYFVPSLNLAIEFFGDYFHSNPKIFDNTHTIFTGRSGIDIRETDESRIKTIKEELKCEVFVVWEYDWRYHRQSVLSTLKGIIDDCYKNSQLS